MSYKEQVEEFVNKKEVVLEKIENKLNEVWQKVAEIDYKIEEGNTFSAVIRGIQIADNYLNTIDGLKLNVVNIKNLIDNELDELAGVKDFIFHSVLINGAGSTVTDRKSNAYITVNPLVQLKVRFKNIKNKCSALEKKLSNWADTIGRNRRDLYYKRKEYNDGLLKAGYERDLENDEEN